MAGSFYHEIDIPGIHLPGNIFLAPLAGYTDMSFRGICRDYGADMTYTEMVSIEGIFYNSGKTRKLFQKSSQEPIRAVQVFASKPDHIPAAAAALAEEEPLLIDINCGCPVPKVVKTGAGAALMKEPKKIGDIVLTLKTALEDLNHPIPITVKLRSGLDAASINYLECAHEAVKAGASLICLHPRTRTQGYSGKADWAHIKTLKAEVPVPVFGSGDLFTPEDALHMLEMTGCDGVMIARGSIGNPYIFTQIKELLTLGTVRTNPGPREMIGAAITHLNLARQETGSDSLPGFMKKHLLAYTKGLSRSAVLRFAIAETTSYTHLMDILELYIQRVNL